LAQPDSYRLLVIDDDEHQFVFVNDLLRATPLRSATIDWTPSSSDGLARLRDERFDAALVDYQLDAHNGLELVRQARAEGLDTPLIMLTGCGDRHLDLEAMEAGASDFLDKGTLSAGLLERAIRYAVRERESIRQLREREEHFRALIQFASDAILLLDTTGTVLFASESFEAVSGISRELVIGRSAFARVHPEDVDDLRARFKECVSHPGLRMAAEYRAQHPDGSWRYREITAVNRLDHPAVRAVVVNYRDVTRRKRGEAERATLAAIVQSSEDAYRSIFEGSPIGLAHVSLQGRWLRANARLLEMLGYTEDELTTLSFADINHPDEVEQAIDAARAMIEGRQRTFAVEKRYRRKDGSYLWVRLHVSLYRDAGGEPRYFIACAEDISSRRAADDARALLEEQFRQAQKMEAVGRLAGGVAHDFNNLLTAIIGYSELALDEPAATGTVRRDLEEIHKAAQSAAGLTRQLLAFSRRQMLQPQTLDVNDVIRRIESLLRRLIGEDVELVVRLSSVLSSVHADPTQIEQIIVNLAVNSRDAMPQGGRLIIETADIDVDADYVAQHRGAAVGPHVMLTVTDSGVGMDDATKKRLFEPFFTTKERGRGTGLGLATVYGIVQQSGGSIWVYSELGRGTTFKILLPAVARVSRDADDTMTALHSLRGSETILVVDDQPEVRAIAREALARQGYTVLEAGSPPDALAVIERTSDTIDLLFTDVVMPQASGRTLALRLTARWPRLKVIYTSGYADAAIVQDSIIAPSLVFLPKPFTARALITKVREVLDAPRAPEV
jgi:PAS domain S-box-containing protein